MEDKKAMVLEQLQRMQEGAQRCVDQNVKYYVMHASCAVEFAKNVQELLQTETHDKLRIGDYVIMNEKYPVSTKNQGRVLMIRSSEQEIGGKTCVFLRHYIGAYAVDGLIKVSRKQAEEILEERIGTERIEELQRYFDHESNDEETQEWRDDLTEEEILLVEIWDKRYDKGIEMILNGVKI